MSENLILALQITVLGMALVFLGIIIIWGVMLALTASTSKQSRDVVQKEESTDLYELRAKAAAAAVAVVLAEQQQAGVSRFPIPPTALVSAWQLTMRNRQLNHEGRPK